MEAPSFPGAVAPERGRRVVSMGVEIQVHEWGDPDASPLVLSHGMFDHGRGFDSLAPLLAERFRVIAFDQRGHGDSAWADAYTWETDIVDLLNVAASAGRPVHLVGHSKGGGQVTNAATWHPECVRQVVNIDGFGPPPEGFTRPGGPPPSEPLPVRLRDFLERRRRAADRDRWRPYPELEALMRRRSEQNPRLSSEWLRYFCFHAARRLEEGWVWKSDPLAGQGFGPWRPEWIAPGWRRLRAPLLAVTGSEDDTWGPLPEDCIAERLACIGDLERAVVPGAGHFVHMEKPRETAELLVGFLER